MRKAQNDPAVLGPVQRQVRPRAWERDDGMKAITDDELEAWIQAGDGQIMDDYTVPLYDQAALDAAVAEERVRCLYWCSLGDHEGYTTHQIQSGAPAPLGPNV